MSWGELYSQTFDLDSEIYNKLACLALNQDDKGKLLSHDECILLDDPIRFDESLRHLDPTELPRQQLEDAVNTLKSENELLYDLFYKVNEERKLLRNQNFGLLQKLFELSESESPAFDKNYFQFCTRSVFLIKELQAKLLEREQGRNQRLIEALNQKDLIIAEMQAEVDQRDLDIRSLKVMFRQSLTQDPAFIYILSTLDNPDGDDKEANQREKLLSDVVFPAKNRQHRFDSAKSSCDSTNGSSKTSVCSQPFDGAEKNLQQEINQVIKEKLMKRINELKVHRESQKNSSKRPKSIQKRGSSATESQLEEFLKNRAANLSIDECELLSQKVPEGQENLLDVKDIISKFDSLASLNDLKGDTFAKKESDGPYSHRNERSSQLTLNSLLNVEQSKTQKSKNVGSNQMQRKSQLNKFASTTTNRGGPKKFDFDEPINANGRIKTQRRGSMNNSFSHFQQSETSYTKEPWTFGRRRTIATAAKTPKNSNLPSHKKQASNDQSAFLNELVALNLTQVNRPRFNHYSSKSLSSKNLFAQNTVLNTKSPKNGEKVNRIKPKSKTAHLDPVEAHSKGANLQKISKNELSQSHHNGIANNMSLEDKSGTLIAAEYDNEEKRQQSEYKKQLLRERLRAQCLLEDIAEESLVVQAEAVPVKPLEVEKAFNFREGWNKLKEIFFQATQSNHTTTTNNNGGQ